MPGEHHAIGSIELHGSCKNDPLDIATDLGEILGILRMRHAGDILLDDRALVKFRRV